MRIPSCQLRVLKVAHLLLLRSCHQRICPLGCGDLGFECFKPKKQVDEGATSFEGPKILTCVSQTAPQVRDSHPKP